VHATLQDIFDFSPARLGSCLRAWGEPDFRVKQVIAAAWTPGLTKFSRATSLPQRLRERLERSFLPPGPPAPKKTLVAADGTVKALFAFAGGTEVESVAIPQEHRLTFCLSSQHGCALGCRFCATGRLGLVRNLTAGEILQQVRGLMAVTRLKPTNLVLMGMGEPLQNLPAVREALALIGHPQALNWSPRKTTISTSGWLPGIADLTRTPAPAKLALSLNTPRDDVRSRLMPVNRRFPLSRVLAGLRAYARATGQSVTLEYVLIQGINAAPADARLLARLVKNLPAKVNLIPLNPVPQVDYLPPSTEDAMGFLQILRRQGVPTTLRLSRGLEIAAACGQLAGGALRRAA